MKWTMIALVSAGALLLCADAEATTAPTLSGAYAFSYTSKCQPTIGVHYDGKIFQSQIGGISLDGPEEGQIELGAGTVTFKPSSQTYTATGVSETGSDLILLSTAGDGSGNQTDGSALANGPTNIKKTSYSTTATTVTLGGQTYSAFYGLIAKAGVADYAALVGLSSDGCAIRLELYHQ